MLFCENKHEISMTKNICKKCIIFNIYTLFILWSNFPLLIFSLILYKSIFKRVYKEFFLGYDTFAMLIHFSHLNSNLNININLYLFSILIILIYSSECLAERKISIFKSRFILFSCASLLIFFLSPSFLEADNNLQPDKLIYLCMKGFYLLKRIYGGENFKKFANLSNTVKICLKVFFEFFEKWVWNAFLSGYYFWI